MTTTTDTTPATQVEVRRTPMADRFTDLALAVEELANDASDEQLAEVLGRIDIAERTIDAIKKAWKAKVIERIKTTDHNLSIPNSDGTFQTFSIKAEKKVKPKDPAALLDALFAISGGDMQTVANCLSAGAFKHGAIGKELVRAMGGDKSAAQQRFDELFETTFEDKLDAKGAPALSMVDGRFVTKGAFAE